MNQLPEITSQPHKAFDLKSLSRDFFTLFGAHVREAGDGELEVRLPPDLAAHFGKKRLYLVFSAAELSPYEDLVVYGSQVFDRMMSLMEGRGESARWRLPVRDLVQAVDDGPPPELVFANCVVEQVSARLEEELHLAFNFRLVYTADDRHEEIYAITLDLDGRPRPDNLLAQSLGDEPGQIGQDTPDKGLVPPAKPPTLTRLTELAGQAQSLAVAHAEARAVTLETGLHRRLHSTLLRLTTYYRRQMEEIAARDENRAAETRLMMEEDLQRKIADELENHRLQVQIRLVSMAQIGRPVRRYRLELQSQHAVSTLALTRDLHSGNLNPVLCHACRQPATELALCAAGHIAGAGCVRMCVDCGRDTCTACGIQNCAVCGEPVCHDCKRICHICGEWACGRDSLVCPICERPSCATHSFQCRICGQRYCATCQGGGKMCQTCAALEPARPPDMAAWPEELAGLKARYSHWLVGLNARYCIYRATRFLRYAVVVQDRENSEVIYWREGGLLTSLGLFLSK